MLTYLDDFLLRGAFPKCIPRVRKGHDCLEGLSDRLKWPDVIYRHFWNKLADTSIKTEAVVEQCVRYMREHANTFKRITPEEIVEARKQ